MRLLALLYAAAVLSSSPEALAFQTPTSIRSTSIGSAQAASKSLLFRSRSAAHHDVPYYHRSVVTSNAVNGMASNHHRRNRLALAEQKTLTTTTSRQRRALSWRIRRVLSNHWKLLRKRTASLVVAFLLVFTTFTGAAQAVTGGRAGGSFGPSSSSRSSSSPPISRSAPRARTPMSSPRIVIHSGPSSYGNGYWGNSGYSQKQFLLKSANTSPAKLTVAEKAVLTTVGAAAIYGVVNSKSYRENYRKGVFGPTTNAGPLGSGATATQLTVALNVPDRDQDPNNILSTLKRISNRADTTTRQGVQDLVSDVALELLRQENSIISAFADSSHHATSVLAQRAFSAQSIASRSKFDRESVNKFGDQVQNSSTKNTENSDSSRATNAVVTINFAIEGDSTGSLPRGIRSRQDLLETLSRVASDVQVDECLLSGEVLWAPSEPGEVLSREDLYADYPNLIPL